jgi:hypothetical protein
MGNVTAPSQGLGDAYNYFLYSDCAPLTNLSVIVDVTQDIVANIGLTIQLNAIAPANAPGSWLQYVFVIGGTGAATTIDCRTDYWPPGGTDHVSATVPLMTLPNRGAAFPTLPAGYQLTIGLTNDSAGNILAATFLVVDTSTGQAKSSGPIQPLGAPTPISAFELNIVGPATARQALLTSGAGTITYEATCPLTVLGSLSGLSKNCISADWVTGESANTSYGGLPAGPYLPSNPINQTFTVAAVPFYKPGAAFAVSQRIGLNQTNLYVVDKGGQIAVFNVQGSGRWSILLPPLGPTGFAKTGACLAASQQFGANQQTNLFVVDQHGDLQTFWTEAGGAWNGPDLIAKKMSSGQFLAVSQQFGAPNQTDLFLVDGNGTLNVFWVQSAGSWNGPVLVGPANHAPKHAPLAVSQQFGSSEQTDVFVVDNTGALTVFWIKATGPWSAPVSISKPGVFPAGAHIAVSEQFGAPNQTDVFAIDNHGQLTAYWVQGTGGWGGPVAIGSKGLAPAGAPVAVSQHFGVPDQTDVYVFDKSGTLNVFSVQGTGPWSSGVTIGPSGLAPTEQERSSGDYVAACQQFGVPAQTDVFVINQTGVGGPGWPTVLWDDGGRGWSEPGALQTQV